MFFYKDSLVDAFSVRWYKNISVPFELVRHPSSVKKLAYFIPGRGYTVEMPLFYYLTREAYDAGYDLLLMKLDYATNTDLAKIPQEYLDECIRKNSEIVLHRAQDDKGNSRYKELLFAGKSLGTHALSLMRYEDDLKKKFYFLTPLIKKENVLAFISALNDPWMICMGDNDPHFNPEVCEAILRGKPNGTIQVIEDADHGMEMPDHAGSLETLEKVRQAFSVWLHK